MNDPEGMISAMAYSLIYNLDELVFLVVFVLLGGFLYWGIRQRHPAAKHSSGGRCLEIPDATMIRDRRPSVPK